MNGTTRPLRLLLVDDSPDDRLLPLRELRKDYPSVEARSVIDAAQLEQALEAGGFDLVITNHPIHWTDVLSVLASVKRRYPDCPVIMFTSADMEEVALEAMKRGLDDYIVKSAGHLSRLRRATRSILDRSEARCRAKQLESRLKAILSQLNVGVFRCTVDGRLLEANEAFFRLAGFHSLEEAQKAPLDALFSSEDHRQLRASLPENGRSREREMRLRQRRGDCVWARVCEMLVTQADGSLVIDGLLEDITQRKQLEEAAQDRSTAVARMSLLTPRELEVTELVAAGQASKSIARRLDVSLKTVEMHRSNAKKKLRVESVTAMVKLVIASKPAGGETTKKRREKPVS